MARATPGWATPDAPAAPPGGDGGASRGRTALAAVLVGLIVLAGSAVGAFALEGGFDRAKGQSVLCGPLQNCIPSLPTSEVIGVLEEKGFECESRTESRWSCRLEIGTNAYEMFLTASLDDPEQIAEVDIKAAFPPGEGQPTGLTRNYFQWFATLPYTDPADVEEVSAWLNEQIDGGQAANVVIGGYEYELGVSPDAISLLVRGVFEE